MQIEIARSISSLVLGQLQRCGNMAVVPLFNRLHDGPDYLTLGEAMAQHQLTVTEFATEGSWPQLNVINWAPQPVLLLAGDELHGQSQMESLDQSLLLQEQSETLFSASYTLAKRRHRRRSFKFNPLALTTALDDGDRDDLRDYLRAFQLVPGQKGLLAIINGQVVGLEMVSRQKAYRALHQNLVKKYSLLASRPESEESEIQFRDNVMGFFKAAAECEESRYSCLGYGLHYQLDGPGVSGMALLSGRHLIHLSLSVFDFNPMGLFPIQAQAQSFSQAPHASGHRFWLGLFWE